MPLRNRLVAAAVFAVFGWPARAQSVQGAVRDAATNAPISGVVVLSLDSTATVRSRSVTDVRGEFGIAMGKAGQILRFVRIGFVPEERRPRVAGDGFARLDVSMRPVSHMLDPVRVSANPNCPPHLDSELALSLWEQVRAALLAAVVARETNPPRTVRVAYKRLLSNDDHIAQQFVQIDSTAATTRSFVAVVSPEDLARGGFPRDTTGLRQVLVPYADLLLDEAFIARHCFRIAANTAGRRNQVGLLFEPRTRPRNGVDVEGVVWADTVARTLVNVEFHYAGLASVGRLGAGGEMSFRQMANGLLIIDRWHIRGRGAKEAPPRDELGALPPTTHEVALLAHGGEVVEASWPDGLTWHAPLGRFALRAVDSSGRAVGGVELRLRGTNYSARTDDRGVAEIARLLPGPYQAVVVDSLLGRVGLGPLIPLAFTAYRDSVVERSVTIRGALQNLLAFCATSSALQPDDAFVVVRVRTPDGRPASRPWEVTWTIPGTTHEPAILGAYRTSTDGTLNRCLRIKRGAVISIHVQATHDSAVTTQRRIEGVATVIGITVPNR
jgi:hypothetical protein